MLLGGGSPPFSFSAELTAWSYGGGGDGWLRLVDFSEIARLWSPEDPELVTRFLSMPHVFLPELVSGRLASLASVEERSKSFCMCFSRLLVLEWSDEDKMFSNDVNMPLTVGCTSSLRISNWRLGAGLLGCVDGGGSSFFFACS